MVIFVRSYKDFRNDCYVKEKNVLKFIFYCFFYWFCKFEVINGFIVEDRFFYCED